MSQALVRANENRPQAWHQPYYFPAGKILWTFDIYFFSRRKALEEMGPSNAGILDYVTNLPARQTVLRDAHEISKAAITVQDCSWEEKFLRNIEFNTLGMSEAHVRKNQHQRLMRAFVTEAESTNRARHLRSRPDFIYGWIPPRHVIDDDEIPAWSKQEAEAVDGTNLLYPF